MVDTNKLWLPSTPCVKIIDFGFTKRFDLCKTKAGTHCFMAPEVLSGMIYDGTASDVWSLGCLLFFSFHFRSQPPFPYNIQTVEDHIRNHPQLDLNGLIIQNQELKNLIGECLKLDPRTRITARELALKLSNLNL